jgi:hypothetical protein
MGDMEFVPNIGLRQQSADLIVQFQVNNQMDPPDGGVVGDSMWI